MSRARGIRPRRSGRSRTSLLIAVAGALLLATLGMGPSGGVTASEAPPLRLHIGPLAIFDEVEDFEANFAATNLSGETKEVTLNLFDQDGEPIAQDQRTIQPGRTGVLNALLLPAVQKVRGSVVSPEDGRWALSLTVDGSQGDDILWFSDRRSAKLEGRATTALLPALGDDTFHVNVTNLGQDATSFTVRLVDAQGNAVASEPLHDVPARSTGGVNFGLVDGSVRAVVIAPSNQPYLAAAQSSEKPTVFTITINY